MKKRKKSKPATLKSRTLWRMKPTSRVKASAKAYSRKKLKKAPLDEDAEA
jgi:hypothetical protein